MSVDWNQKALGDACDLIARGIAPKYIDAGGLRVLNQKCIRDHAIDYGLARRHDNSAKPVKTERLIRVGDVLVNSTGVGTLGRVAQVRKEPDEPTTVDTHVTIVRPKVGAFDMDFFGFSMVRIEDEISKSGEGSSGQTELARAKLAKNFFVCYPNCQADQRRIVAILDEAFAGIATATENAATNLANALELFASLMTNEFAALEAEAEQYYLEDCLEKVKVGVKINKRNFLSTGKYPIISQEADFINGRWNIADDLVRLKKPVVVFGDHTQVVKYVDFDFVVGADGVKILAPKAKLNARFLAYFLKANPISSLGYARHYRLIKRLDIPIPPLARQISICDTLDRFAKMISSVEQVYERKLVVLGELKKEILRMAFSGELTSAAKAVAA